MERFKDSENQWVCHEFAFLNNIRGDNYKISPAWLSQCEQRLHGWPCQNEQEKAQKALMLHKTV